MQYYLDYNATAPWRPEVIEAMHEVQALPLNPSSVHSWGRKAKSLVEDARRKLAETLGVFPAEVIFTSSGTEANNWVLKAFSGNPILLSAIEHSSLWKTGQVYGALHIPVTPNGVVDREACEQMIAQQRGKPFLASVMLANNETGVIQPVREIADSVHRAGGLFHCDAVQALGKIPVDFNDLGCDLLTVCAHKMGGPVGVGALIVKNTVPLPPFLTGGGQELNRRAGTENVAAMVGFAKVLEFIDLPKMGELGQWRDEMEKTVSAQGAIIIGKACARLPNTSCIVMPHMNSETQLIRLDLNGIAVSAGSACSSGRIEPSPVLVAMGMDAAFAMSAIRISGGWATTAQEFGHFAERWCAMAESKGRKQLVG